MSRIIAFISLIALGFIWIISGGLLMLSMMHIGDRNDVFEVLIKQDIPVLEFTVKGYVVVLVFFLSLIGVISLNEYFKKKK